MADYYYSRFNTNLFITSDIELTNSDYIEMLSPRPSVDYVSQANGTWVYQVAPVEPEYMDKQIYDVDNNGVVDNAEKVNSHTVDIDVPSTADFTSHADVLVDGDTVTPVTPTNKIVTETELNSVSGDMDKSVYDTNDNGVVDDAEKVNGHTVHIDVPPDTRLTKGLHKNFTLTIGKFLHIATITNISTGSIKGSFDTMNFAPSFKMDISHIYDGVKVNFMLTHYNNSSSSQFDKLVCTQVNNGSPIKIYLRIGAVDSGDDSAVGDVSVDYNIADSTAPDWSIILNPIDVVQNVILDIDITEKDFSYTNFGTPPPTDTMYRSIYDLNNNGRVDNADFVPTTTLTADNTQDAIEVLDSRVINNTDAISSFTNASGEIGTSTPFYAGDNAEVNLDFDIITDSSDTSILEFDATNNHILYRKAGIRYIWNTFITVKTHGSPDKTLTVRARSSSDNSLLRTNIVRVDGGNNKVSNVVLPITPFDNVDPNTNFYITFEADDDEVEILDVYSVIQANGNVNVTTSPAGSDKEVQFNDGGVLGAVADFIYDKVEKLLSVFNLKIDNAVELQHTDNSHKGVIYKGTSPFLHDFSHPTGDTAIPVGRNVFMGHNVSSFNVGASAQNVTEGSNNIMVGYGMCQDLDRGHDNCFIGVGMHNHSSFPTYNTVVGVNSAKNVIDSSAFTLLGYQSVNIAQNGDNITSIYNSAVFGAYCSPMTSSMNQENMFGHGVQGHGSFTMTFGASTIHDNYFYGLTHSEKGFIIDDIGEGYYTKSDNGKLWRIRVDDTGAVFTEEITTSQPV